MEDLLDVLRAFLGSFSAGCWLVAGHETTVTAINAGVVLLATHPEQRDMLRADPALLPTAVEEILRVAVPQPAKPATAQTTPELEAPAAYPAGPIPTSPSTT